MSKEAGVLSLTEGEVTAIAHLINEINSVQSLAEGAIRDDLDQILGVFPQSLASKIFTASDHEYFKDNKVVLIDEGCGGFYSAVESSLEVRVRSWDHSAPSIFEGTAGDWAECWKKIMLDFHDDFFEVLDADGVSVGSSE